MLTNGADYLDPVKMRQLKPAHTCRNLRISNKPITAMQCLPDRVRPIHNINKGGEQMVTVSQLMKRDLVSVDSGTSVVEAAKLMKACNVGSVLQLAIDSAMSA